MPENVEDSYTILEFVDVSDGGKVYRGDELIHEFGFSSLDGFEKALKEFGKIYQRIRLVAEHWELMADLSFGREWDQKNLSEIIAEAKARKISIETYPKP